ncbi:MAG: macrolide export ATP-binding/permease MacB, partial [Beggiatoa sp. IS2]
EVQRMTLLSIAIGGLSLLAGSIGIMNVMLTAVIERRREIGILRAIGARQRDIRWQFLLEAIILSLIGGLLGSGLGIASSYLIAWWNEWQFFVSYQVLLLGVGVSWGVGIFFGFYPAYKAAKLDPIVALRTE